LSPAILSFKASRKKEDKMKHWIFWFLTAMSLFATLQASAQSAGGQIPTNAAGILNSLPPDLYSKLQQLSQILDQNIKAGHITDEQVQQQLMSGQFEQTIRSFGAEANRLMDEISAEMRNGKGPGENALMPLLGGFSGMGK
jgi:hypothetical protein